MLPFRHAASRTSHHSDMPPLRHLLVPPFRQSINQWRRLQVNIGGSCIFRSNVFNQKVAISVLFISYLFDYIQILVGMTYEITHSINWRLHCAGVHLFNMPWECINILWNLKLDHLFVRVGFKLNAGPLLEWIGRTLERNLLFGVPRQNESRNRRS